jgi:ribosomal protein S12 methylthiotransferase accessory factor
MDYRLPLPPAMGCFVMSSNGLASGNHIVEALVHGFAEVIERDAIVLFRMMARAQQDQRHVDLRTVTNPECRRLLDLYENAGVRVGAWDITSDIGIPAFRCVILDRELNPFRPLGPLEGLGCHPVREVALLRALTEAAQSRLTVIFGARDDNGRSEYLESQDANTIGQARERLLEAGTRPFEAVPTRWNDTIEEDLQHLLSCLSNAGIEQAVAVNLSKREFGIPVVRVVVPGLEPYHQVPDFIPGVRARRIALGAAAVSE